MPYETKIETEVSPQQMISRVLNGSATFTKAYMASMRANLCPKHVSAIDDDINVMLALVMEAKTVLYGSTLNENGRKQMFNALRKEVNQIIDVCEQNAGKYEDVVKERGSNMSTTPSKATEKHREAQEAQDAKNVGKVH
ncbi:hypothetical protein [Vibrio coralliirubri]|uniref:hypothetical protein n=1 Tax=Vibrio coralliirubri TaxID=1516159 RepID=UPI000A36E754|nr:hypothetical protein [Vibrio coralliirubri]